jgi:DNA sulfur modification protein DndD
MTTETSEYEGLQITDTYGLNLLHRDREIEEGRSAGAEHVIALALIGALQQNAPFRGPIVMDSPFGRLDEAHTHNVMKALPTMADQVVLLVHSAELRRNQVRETLGSQLIREYELVRVNSRRTKIQQVR